MKHKFLLAIAFLFSVVVAKSDQLVTTSAEIIECEVKIIKDNSVVFRKPGESFDREMDRSNIFKVKFNNGTEEMLQTGNSSKSSNPGVGTVKQTRFKGNDVIESEPDWSAYPPASKAYQIGDWYNENGVEGLVIWTTEDGRHGRLLYPKKLIKATLTGGVKFFTGSKDYELGLNDYANGYANWQRIKYLIDNDPNYSIEMFPLYEYLNQEAPGWYLPAIKELQYLHQLCLKEINYNGKKTKWEKVIPDIVKSHTGKKFKIMNQGSFQSSTETLYVKTRNNLWASPTSNQQYGIFWFEMNNYGFIDDDERIVQHDFNRSTECFMMRHF